MLTARPDPCELAAPDVGAMLDAILVELRALRSDVAALRVPAPRRALAPADRAWLAGWLSAAHAVLGDRVWLASELAAIALRPDCPALAAALGPHVTRGGLRALGKTLARGAGHCVDALALRRVGESSAGVLWQVFETRETMHADSTARPGAR